MERGRKPVIEMLFNSIHYMLFAPLVILAYFRLPARYRGVLLLIASLYFYAVFRPPFILILLGCIVLTYLTGRALADASSRRARRLWLALGIGGNLAILYFFKYIDFSIKIFNQTFQLTACDGVAPWGVILPMGISFFTLQAMAYLVDINRGVIEPSRSIFHFALFLSFFPQLVAGPIMRAKDLLHQFAEEHNFTRENLEIGLRLITLGLFKKTLIADQLSHLVDAVFATPHLYSGAANFLGTTLFIIQIYCDFSGYSDIAIGSGRILGFRIPENFRRPFMAENMTQLWRRWHISLSTWLRDYIYIPMGGSRASFQRVYFNLLVSMVVGGIWHGADWTFVVWGFAHATLIVFERFVMGTPVGTSLSRLPRGVKVGYTVLLFALLAIFFRAQPVSGSDIYTSGLSVAAVMFEQILTLADGQMIEIPFSALAMIALLFGIETFQEWREVLSQRLVRTPLFTYTAAGVVLTLSFLIYSVTSSPQFIYFQF